MNVATEMGSTETLCQNKRNKFLIGLKSHFNLLKLFSAEHEKLLERMTALSTKLSIIESANRPKGLPYSDELLENVKGEILNALNSIYSKINQNLQQQASSFISLRQSHQEFIISSKAIDWSSQSRLCHGSATEKPLIYYIDHSFDIIYCLSIHETTIHLNKSQLDVRDTSLITKFLKNLRIPQNFQDLITVVLLNSCFVDRAEKTKNKS